MSVKAYQIPHTDLTVSRIGYGCGHLAPLPFDPKNPPTQELLKRALEEWKNKPLERDDIAFAARIINTAHENGITLFDHADVYGFGKMEQAFGEVLKQSPDLRDNLLIQSKCGVRFAENLFGPTVEDPNRLDFSREHIVSSAEGSLQRLGTDRLDILLLHRPDALMEPEEVAQAFDDLHRSGKVRYFGVSNHNASQIERLRSYVHQPLVVNQVHLGLAHPYLITDGMEANRDDRTRITRGYTGAAGTLDYCCLHKIQIQAWSPLKGGDNRLDLLNPPAKASQEVRQAAEVLAELAKKKGVTPPAVALAWLLRHPAGIVPIIGTGNPQRIVANCAADDVTLTREEWYGLFAVAAGVSSLRFLGE